MVASKSKKSKRRREGKRKQRRLTNWKKKLEQGPFRGREVVIGPRGEVKMSDVLKDFVEPYRELADTEEAYRKLLTLAVTAWNASLLPEEEQEGMVDSILEGGLPEDDEELKAGLKDIVNMLIERKQAHFSGNKRTIVDFELTDTGREYHLSVVSFLRDASLE